MNRIAQMSARERADVFAETAERKTLAEAIIEKDFWACWTLKQLFSIEPFAGRLLFKSGTSLSKIFHAINRFPENIDLAVDYVALGFKDDKDPRQTSGLRKVCKLLISYPARILENDTILSIFDDGFFFDFQRNLFPGHPVNLV